MKWIQHPADPGIHYTTDDLYDVLEGDDGFTLRKNLGGDGFPYWEPIGTFPTLEAAQEAAK
jgi:hypothetical protein